MPKVTAATGHRIAREWREERGTLPCSLLSLSVERYGVGPGWNFVPVLLVDMLSSLRLNLLIRCPSPASNVSKPKRAVHLSTKPQTHHRWVRHSNINSWSSSRSYSGKTLEKGEKANDEDMFRYFERKVRLESPQDVPTRKTRISPVTDVATSSKPSKEQVSTTKVEVTDKKVTKEDAGSRLDRFITRLFPKLPNSRINKLLRDKKVRIPVQSRFHMI